MTHNQLDQEGRNRSDGDLREAHGLTQRDLANRLGTSQRYVCELEVGEPKIADGRFFELLGLRGLTLTAETRDV